MQTHDKQLIKEKKNFVTLQVQSSWQIFLLKTKYCFYLNL